MKQPWLKFYSSDWRGDVTLGPCSLAARGLWMEMLCIMSEAEPRGSLMKGGRSYTTKQLAALARSTVDEVEGLLAELEAEGVFSRDGDGTIYSRRMRRDIEKEAKDKANGRLGGNPGLKPREYAGVNPSDKDEDKAQKPEARNQKPESSLRDDGARDAIFDRFYGPYPKHTEPGGVRRELFAILDAGNATIEDLEAGARRYAREVAGKEIQFIASPVRWLKDERWKDGNKPGATSARSPPNDQVYVRRDSADWPIYAKRFKVERGKDVPPYGEGWNFPKAWQPADEAAA